MKWKGMACDGSKIARCSMWYDPYDIGDSEELYFVLYWDGDLYDGIEGPEDVSNWDFRACEGVLEWGDTDSVDFEELLKTLEEHPNR